jgi:hypothetical protein
MSSQWVPVSQARRAPRATGTYLLLEVQHHLSGPLQLPCGSRLLPNRTGNVTQKATLTFLFALSFTLPKHALTSSPFLPFTTTIPSASHQQKTNKSEFNVVTLFSFLPVSCARPVFTSKPRASFHWTPCHAAHGSFYLALQRQHRYNFLRSIRDRFQFIDRFIRQHSSLGASI